MRVLVALRHPRAYGLRGELGQSLPVRNAWSAQGQPALALESQQASLNQARGIGGRAALRRLATQLSEHPLRDRIEQLVGVQGIQRERFVVGPPRFVFAQKNAQGGFEIGAGRITQEPDECGGAEPQRSGCWCRRRGRIGGGIGGG